MENFFTRVKDRTTKETWTQGTYGYSGPVACLAGLMGRSNSYYANRLSAQDRNDWWNAYSFATDWMHSHHSMSVEAWNDRYAGSLEAVHQVLDELAMEWEKVHLSETESQKKAKAWLEDAEKSEEETRVEKGWLSIERSFSKVSDKPMYRRFADRVEGWLAEQPVEEKEKVDA